MDDYGEKGERVKTLSECSVDECQCLSNEIMNDGYTMHNHMYCLYMYNRCFTILL